jgi:hypothetical protein
MSSPKPSTMKYSLSRLTALLRYRRLVYFPNRHCVVTAGDLLTIQAAGAPPQSLSTSRVSSGYFGSIQSPPPRDDRMPRFRGNRSSFDEMRRSSNTEHSPVSAPPAGHRSPFQNPPTLRPTPPRGQSPTNFSAGHRRTPDENLSSYYDEQQFTTSFAEALSHRPSVPLPLRQTQSAGRRRTTGQSMIPKPAKTSPKKTKPAKKTRPVQSDLPEQPLYGIVVLSEGALTGPPTWVPAATISAAMATQMEQANSICRAKNGYENHASLNTDNFKVACLHCRLVEKLSCTRQTAQRACDRCVTKRRPCASFVRHNKTTSVGFVPLPKEDRKGIHRDAAFWVVQDEAEELSHEAD